MLYIYQTGGWYTGHVARRLCMHTVKAEGIVSLHSAANNVYIFPFIEEDLTRIRSQNI